MREHCCRMMTSLLEHAGHECDDRERCEHHPIQSYEGGSYALRTGPRETVEISHCPFCAKRLPSRRLVMPFM